MDESDISYIAFCSAVVFLLMNIFAMYCIVKTYRNFRQHNFEFKKNLLNYFFIMSAIIGNAFVVQNQIDDSKSYKFYQQQLLALESAIKSYHEQYEEFPNSLYDIQNSPDYDKKIIIYRRPESETDETMFIWTADDKYLYSKAWNKTIVRQSLGKSKFYFFKNRKDKTAKIPTDWVFSGETAIPKRN